MRCGEGARTGHAQTVGWMQNQTRGREPPRRSTRPSYMVIRGPGEPSHGWGRSRGHRPPAGGAPSVGGRGACVPDAESPAGGGAGLVWGDRGPAGEPRGRESAERSRTTLRPNAARAALLPGAPPSAQSGGRSGGLEYWSGDWVASLRFSGGCARQWDVCVRDRGRETRYPHLRGGRGHGVTTGASGASLSTVWSQSRAESCLAVGGWPGPHECCAEPRSWGWDSGAIWGWGGSSCPAALGGAPRARPRPSCGGGCHAPASPALWAPTAGPGDRNPTEEGSPRPLRLPGGVFSPQNLGRRGEKCPTPRGAD